uniref:LAM_G_DOMAIN domain-containing protein n=1 Tax=Elaeophora elaphi TaxID=1147741 RepID=A0A0R3RH36_9BILA
LQAFPNPNYIIYGLRDDSNILLLPSTVARNASAIKRLAYLLDDESSATSKKNIEHYNAMLIEVHGLLQFITIWQETAASTGKLYTFTRLSYFEAFRLVFVPTPTKIIHAATFTTLMYFSDLSKRHFSYQTTADSRVFLYQIGEGRIGQYEIIFGRAGTKLFIDGIRKSTKTWSEPPILMVMTKKTTKWLARRQKSVISQIDCIVETASKFGVGILYNRKNLVNAYYEMGDSAFDCIS